MNLFAIDILDIIKATLVFLRVGGILFFLPIFGDSPTPARVRILLAGAITFVFYGLVPHDWNSGISVDALSLGWAVVKELFIGFTLGFVARIGFDGILMAASLVGYQMGFGMANLLVPDADQQLNAFTAFHRIVVILIFFGLNLHHIFLNGIGETFHMIQPGGVLPNADLGNLLIQLTSGIFWVAIQLSAPVLVALLFTMAALGLIARTVPQMNVFTLSFPVSFFVGLLVYLASMPFMHEWIGENFTNVNRNLLLTVKGLAP